MIAEKNRIKQLSESPDPTVKAGAVIGLGLVVLAEAVQALAKAVERK